MRKIEPIDLREGQRVSRHIALEHRVPRQLIRYLLRVVSLLNTLAAVLQAETVEALSELHLAFLEGLLRAVDDVYAALLERADLAADAVHVARKPCDVGGHRGDAAEGALCRSVPPGLVDGRENAEMAATDKVIVVNWKDWACRGDELGMIDDFDPVVTHVEQVMLVDIPDNLCIRIYNHIYKKVMGNNHKKYSKTINKY